MFPSLLSLNYRQAHKTRTKMTLLLESNHTVLVWLVEYSTEYSTNLTVTASHGLVLGVKSTDQTANDKNHQHNENARYEGIRFLRYLPFFQYFCFTGPAVGQRSVFCTAVLII